MRHRWLAPSLWARAASPVASGTGRRTFYATLDPVKERRLKSCSITFNKPRGRDMASDLFEQKVHLVQTDALGLIYKNAGTTVAVVDLVAQQDFEEGFIPHPATVPQITELGITTYDWRMKKNMQRNSDSWTRSYNTDGCAVIHVIGPVVNHRMYRREEAQVEMITAYRNAIYEFYDLKQSSHKGLLTLRVPALSLYTADRFQHDLGKLNQQALLKGFHRCPGFVKDWFSATGDVRVEIYVPGDFIEQFTTAFAEDAWPPVGSTFDPGRLQLYSGMPVPRPMLDYPGWVGKRPELERSVETEGQSIEDAREIDPHMMRKSRERYYIGASGRRGDHLDEQAKAEQAKDAERKKAMATPNPSMDDAVRQFNGL